MDFERFYELAVYGNKAWKGSFTQWEITQNAYDYLCEFNTSVENGEPTEIIKELYRLLVQDGSEECLNWAYTIATEIGLIDMDFMDYMETDPKIIERFVIQGEKMKVEKNVTIQRKSVDNVRKKDFHKPYTKVLIDFVNGNDNNICMEFGSNEELNRAYGCIRRYHKRHELNVVDFKINQELNKLYLVRKQPKERRKQMNEDKITISSIIFQHGNDDYVLWEEFSLTEEEENKIWEILSKHETEGCSVRGTRKQIAREM